MNKTIIATWGVSNQGKSESIKNVCRIILDTFDIAEPSIPKEQIDYSKDILLSVKIGTITIGFESQGDPNSRMICQNSIESLVDAKCDIIVCATRSSGATSEKVHQIAQKNNYQIIWKTNYTSDSVNHTTLNRLSALDTIDLIKSIITCEL